MNPYEVLGVAPGAEQEAITGAYRALARKYHPDCNPSGAERMKAINAAYELLSDPGRRAAYNRQRPAESRGGSRTSTPPPPPPRPEPPPAPICMWHSMPVRGECRWCSTPLCESCRGAKRGSCSDCRAGELQSRLAVVPIALGLGAAVWALLMHVGPPGSLVLTYPVPALITGARLAERFRATPVARQLSAGLRRLGSHVQAQPATAPQRLALWLLRWLATGFVGVLVCPVELVWTAALLSIEMRAGGGRGLAWWQRRRHQLFSTAQWRSA